MNGDDQFEKHLQRLPQRSIPVGWRAEILNAARRAATVRSSPRAGQTPLRAALTALLWPNPEAWAALAAVWVVIFGLQIAAREPGRSELAHQAPQLSPQMFELLKQQEQLLAELVGPLAKPAISPAKPPALQPRSQRRESLISV